MKSGDKSVTFAVNVITSDPALRSICPPAPGDRRRARVNLTFEPRWNKSSLSEAILTDMKVCDNKESQFPDRLALVARQLIQIACSLESK